MLATFHQFKIMLLCSDPDSLRICLSLFEIYLNRMLPLLISWLLLKGSDGARAIWALNAGGGSHRGVDGVMYKPDVADMPGVVSDHGVTHVPLLARVHPQVSKTDITHNRFL